MRKALWLEWFRLRKRLATWIVYVLFLTLTLFLLGSLFYSRQHGHVRGPYLGFPDAWETVLTAGAPLASMFGAVLMALSVSSEFEWRTSRQNIIDGQSKENWLLGKLLLIPAICLALYGTQLVIGTAWAYLDTYPPHKVFLYPVSTYLAAGCGAFVGMLWYATVGLFIAVLVRSTGAAIGLTLIYQVFDSLVAHILVGFRLDDIAKLFPFQVHKALLEFGQYWPGPSPTLDYHWITLDLLFAGVVWTAAFAIATRWVYLQRDL